MGAGKNAKSSICMTIGTGIGGCVILNNKLVHGFSNSAGEVGYMNINGESFQDVASTTSLVKKVAKIKNIPEQDINRKIIFDMAKNNDEDSLPQHNISGKIIFDMAKNNDKDCLNEIDNMVKSLAIGISNVCYVINPEVVILGGGIMAQEEFLRPRIDKALKEVLVPKVYENTKIEFAKRQNDAGMIGALYNFLN